jgi:TM2 domain-containing membrane protein YozV
MPDEGRCPHCGSATPTDMPRCIHCGQRLAGLLLRTEEYDAYSEPWWRVSSGTVPLPPQVKAEMERQETVAREAARFAEERRVAEEQAKAREEARTARKEQREREEEDFWTRPVVVPMETQAAAAAESTTKVAGQTLGNCTNCGASLGEAGHTFSFCLRCGADVSAEARQKTKTVVDTVETEGVQPAAVRQRITVETMSITRAVETERTTTPNPIGAAFLSFVLPGLGQLVNGQGAKGVLLLLALFVTMGLFGWPAFSLPVMVGRVLAAVDAYRIADRKRENKPVRDGEWDIG